MLISKDDGIWGPVLIHLGNNDGLQASALGVVFLKIDAREQQVLQHHRELCSVEPALTELFHVLDIFGNVFPRLSLQSSVHGSRVGEMDKG